ncbi:MAG TPA: NAD(P)/FAD-dependent oxidoreductase [Candidatus Limnocylindria bacterium]|nr:NAD(P)/FAD-dependent oxidoreductase [Candidatus Limnocylindria bacterium]
MDAAVVGSGPNGLSAAIELARNGRSVVVYEANDTIGGGCRSAELTLPGFVHDLCSAFHPLGAASPFFRSLGLAKEGLEWIEPPIAMAHPLDDGTAVLLERSLDATARGLGEADGRAYRRLVAQLVPEWDDLAAEALGPVIKIPRHPFVLARLGIPGLLPARFLARRAFGGERARALFAGLAAHAVVPLDAPLTASFALMFAVVTHVASWPIPRGGSQRIADALAARLRSLGGTIETGRRVTTLDDLEKARAYLCDVTPRQLDRIAGPRLSESYRAKLRAFRYGPGVFKLDYAIDGPIPWRAKECLGAGTVHLGGTLDEIAGSEAEVARGHVPERPFVLVGQQSLFDLSRAPAGKHTVWAYCHVPNGSTVDMTGRVEAQLERFAPGFRDRVLMRRVMTPADIERHNENYIGGDIGGGANTFFQFMTRPFFRLDPYSTSARDIYLCSSSTPPGGGVHGMCGYHGARSALRRAFA